MLNFSAYKIKKREYEILFKKLINKENHFNDLSESGKMERSRESEGGGGWGESERGIIESILRKGLVIISCPRCFKANHLRMDLCPLCLSFENPNS